jgi:hypothetical protein
MKEAVFWHIKTQFVPHRKHVTSPLHVLSLHGGDYKNAFFWDKIPSLYFTGNALLLHYRAQPVNAM